MGTDIRLSRRLTAIAEMVGICRQESGRIRQEEPAGPEQTACYCLCDVGTDHAHIPIKLLLDGTITSSIAMDVIEGPLEKARQNIELYGVEDSVDLRLSDGLDAYQSGEADGLVIAGMGGRIMSRILLREPDKSRSFEELVLQPQADPDHVRRAVRMLGLFPDREKIVLEDGKYYPVMHIVHERGERPDWSLLGFDPEDAPAQAFLREVEDEFGPVLLARKDRMLNRYLLWRKGVNDRIAGSLALAADLRSEALADKKKQVERTDRMIRTALEYFDKQY